MITLQDLRLFARYHLVRRAYDHPARDGELDVRSLDYEPAAFETSVRAFEPRFTVREEGRFEYAGESFAALSASSTNADTAARKLLVLSGVHGNEHAGIVSVPEILERYHAARDALASVALRVLTPVNPVGAAELSRFNADGYDINRDFRRFDTGEARMVRRVFEDFRPDFVLSLHEGPQDASFMFANAKVDRALAERLLVALEAGGTALAKKDYFGSTLPRPGLSPSTRATRAVVSLWAATLGMMASNAWSESLGVPELTFESSWRNPDRAARVRAHADLCMALCSELARS